jgi:hypothetical protein
MSPSTTAIRGGARPSSTARAAMRRAAPRGLAAPKLLTMRIPWAMQRASTGRNSSTSSGS